ncbi:calpain-A-like isoform X2 [Periplaneta americana]|uniref:calpain-A-like isoform X2 n=1 Tax=Periplaneta americana TaxID=6978 RepID=UPI0037E8BE72
MADVVADGEFHTGGSTKFKQGELGDCWLAAAIESLRHEKNKEALHEVINADSALEFRFWQKGTYQIVILENDTVPTNEGRLVFLHHTDGNEYWGILLEKAYAKWLGSYEALEGGFWTDAIQSFTGGIVERIKLREGMPDNLFDIMLDAYHGGSSLCCIKKDVLMNEKYHSCCINVVKVEEEETKKVWVRDPNVQKLQTWTFEDFINEYHRLDMCHQTVDNLSELHGLNIGEGEWQAQIITLQFDPEKDLADEYSMTMNEPDDDDESRCTFVLELVQKVKPAEGEECTHINPWEAIIDLDLDVQSVENTEENIAKTMKFPQETFCFKLSPGSYIIKITASKEEHTEIYMRLFTKKSYQLERNE